MLICGVFMRLFPAKNRSKICGKPGVSDADGFAALAAVVILGTICAFSFYMTGLKIIGASRASMIACIEPVSAAAFAFWLGTEFVFLDFAGFTLIISCIFLLAKDRKKA